MTDEDHLVRQEPHGDRVDDDVVDPSLDDQGLVPRNSKDKKFSFGAVTATAIISFLISGIGGALFQRHLSRAKPLVTVTSAGFEGPSDYVEVPDDVVAVSQEDSWGVTLAKYEKFSRLRDREADAAETEARLSKIIALTEAWLRDSEQGPEQLTKAEVLKHPLVTDSLFEAGINGSIRRQELSSPPLLTVSKYATVFPLFERDGDPLLHTGKNGVRFSSSGFMDKRMNEANQLLAESFSRGVRANVVHYTKFLLENDRSNVLTIKKLRENLRALILEQARPAVSITVHNAGDTAVAFRPYFGMTVLASDDKSVTDTYLMLIDQPQSTPPTSASGFLQAILEQPDNRDTSKQVKVDPYLPRTGGLSYTTISPGASTTLRLVATEKFGAKGSKYRTSYESGLLKTRILALTVAGENVWSDVSVFGSNVNKVTEDDLIRRLK